MKAARHTASDAADGHSTLKNADIRRAGREACALRRGALGVPQKMLKQRTSRSSFTRRRAAEPRQEREEITIISSISAADDRSEIHDTIGALLRKPAPPP